MKKINVLVAVFSILSMAAVAKAQDISVDFDGAQKIKPQSMHEMFAATHQIVPASVLKEAPAISGAAADRAIHSGDPCCDDPNPMILCYAPCPPDLDGLIKSTERSRGENKPRLSAGAYKALRAYYDAQPRIKMLVAGYYIGKGNSAAAAKLGNSSARVLASGSVVLVIADGRQERISDPALAASVKAAVGPVNVRGVGELIEIGGALIDIATDDDMWEDIGDGVSAASEAYTEWYYTHGPGSGSRN